MGPKLEMQTQNDDFFISVVITYLLIDCIKILLAKQLKTKLTPVNILKSKRNQYCNDGFGMVLITQGWFPEEKAMVKKAFEK
jgi:hypothetical protein